MTKQFFIIFRKVHKIHKIESGNIKYSCIMKSRIGEGALIEHGCFRWLLIRGSKKKKVQGLCTGIRWISFSDPFSNSTINGKKKLSKQQHYQSLEDGKICFVDLRGRKQKKKKTFLHMA
jgi:hypothetical protein